MLKLAKEIAAELNRRAGVSLQQTYLYRAARQEPRPAAGAGANGIVWEILSAGRISSLREIGPFDPDDGMKRLRRGDLCYTVSICGRLAHYSWVQRYGAHPISEAGLSVPVGDGAFWIYNCRTAEWSRGQGIYPATLDHIMNERFSEDGSAAWIYTSRENIASQRGILRAGFVQVSTLKALRVGTFYRRVSGEIGAGASHYGQ